MNERDLLLAQLRNALDRGVVTPQDIGALVAVSSPSEPQAVVAPSKAPKKLSVVQTLFYVVGIILFAAVLSVIAQTWQEGTATHLALTILLGLCLWVVAYVFAKRSTLNDIVKGMVDALLLTGSLLLITGGYIITNLFGEYGHVDFFEAAPMFLVLAAVHAGAYTLLRRDLLYLMSLLLSVALVGTLVFGILRDADAPFGVVSLAIIALMGLLVWATRVITRLVPSASHLGASYDRLAIVVSLLCMYIASFGSLSGLWYLALAGAIFGVYCLSIVSKQKVLLGTASTALVLVTITVAFRYFSAFGVTSSLIFSAMAILAVAVLASQLSKKYLS